MSADAKAFFFLMKYYTLLENVVVDYTIDLLRTI